mmetsp:Transcript_20456/g.52851  ORF Transcript_20456/g.52851 Transcript_20456/m.52851 type:complete len:207 (-) Transcript_20456:770-1390(-)
MPRTCAASRAQGAPAGAARVDHADRAARGVPRPREEFVEVHLAIRCELCARARRWCRVRARRRALEPHVIHLDGFASLRVVEAQRDTRVGGDRLRGELELIGDLEPPGVDLLRRAPEPLITCRWRNDGGRDAPVGAESARRRVKPAVCFVARAYLGNKVVALSGDEACCWDVVHQVPAPPLGPPRHAGVRAPVRRVARRGVERERA